MKILYAIKSVNRNVLMGVTFYLTNSQTCYVYKLSAVCPTIPIWTTTDVKMAEKVIAKDVKFIDSSYECPFICDLYKGEKFEVVEFLETGLE